MLDRYTRLEMKQLWGREETKLEYWLKVELAWNEVRAARGDISREAADAIAAKAKIDVARMKEIEDEVGHDMIAFVTMVQESLVAAGVGQHKERLHELLTSYNTEDPAMILMLRQAVEYIVPELRKLRDALRERAREHKTTYMIARSHGQFAEPDTFGRLLLVFANAIDRGIRRIEAVYDEDLIDANISGAVGSYGEIDPELEEQTADLLGLRPALAETQILQRDRHAALLSAIAIVGGSIEQMARTLWEMARSDVKEVEEPRSKKQKGSSAMAHKKNPIGLEQLMGLARILRACAQAAFENIATPEARDISQSSVERHIFADATSLLHYMAIRATNLIKGLVVFPDQMRHHLEIDTYGTWAGQPVRTALMRKGVDYETAYRYVQKASFHAIDKKVPLRTALLTMQLSETDHRWVGAILSESEYARCFDYKEYIGRGIEHVFRVNGLN
jgi:adenylosuccinate lyase